MQDAVQSCAAVNSVCSYRKRNVKKLRGDQMENCISRLFEEVWNRRQTDLINEICSDDFVFHYGIETSGGRDQLRGVIDQWLDAFPDIQHEISDTIVQNDKTTVRWRGHGVHQGSFMGIPGNRRRL